LEEAIVVPKSNTTIVVHVSAKKDL